LNRLLFTADLCLAPWPSDGHPDHDAAGRVAVDVAQSRGVAVLSYLVWMWHWGDPHSDVLPWASFRRWTMTPVERARKRWASAAFESQIAAAGPAAEESAIVPPPVLRRFWRPFEIFVDVDACR
jgi:LmbE family N-acetylglucosaminyl deacetylase